ncbi:Mitochondrial import inner membrane translocase subunit Tim21 [Vigna unguiculata]|uniref:Mitochondrial import inner membrane translocase subunit Tim21 n=1 Tax=Vigna unguiculata TaxID=3917 RepID=A0A4D6N6F0_VIGUN|nr:Mitochondrial import inner membrane translocase subunit Tim21 [Vigna unguiculata]
MKAYEEEEKDNRGGGAVLKRSLLATQNPVPHSSKPFNAVEDEKTPSLRHVPQNLIPPSRTLGMHALSRHSPLPQCPSPLLPNQRIKAKKDIASVEEDPFSAPTYNIPEKPVTFVEGASYSVVILAGLGIAAAAGYAVFKELIFQPKEYKIYSKALKRIQDDGQVRVRIGSPITGYGQESRNRAARQRIPHRVWTDEEGVEHVEVNFYIRGPHGHGKVFCEMFKGSADNEWKFTYLIVEIRAPSTAQLILESYIPSYNATK